MKPDPIPPPISSPRRHTARAFPAYRHVPGLTPHPENHPDGHSFGGDVRRPPDPPCHLPEDWAECEAYLYGVDLFNHGYLWEAHEAWEGLWQRAPRGPARSFLQALIQVAAALLKKHLGRDAGARRLWAKSSANLDRVVEHLGEARLFLGVDLPSWRADVRQAMRGSRLRVPFLRLDPPS